jgi:hypothetical protein
VPKLGATEKAIMMRSIARSRRGHLAAERHRASTIIRPITRQNLTPRQRTTDAFWFWIVRRPHQQRMMVVLHAFTNELSQVSGDGVSSFLLHYACCEALTHIAWAAVEWRTPQEGLDWDFDYKQLGGKGPLTLGDMKKALRKLDPSLDDEVIERVFKGGKRSPFASGSAKFLRNKIMHELRQEAIEQVRARGAQLLADMQAVIAALKIKAADPAGIRTAD